MENINAIAFLMRLADWLTENGKTQQWLATQLGVTQGRVSQVARLGTDSLRLAAKIERITAGLVPMHELIRAYAATTAGASEPERAS